tara:strand:+ start:500 stop:2281 length:1782 start_codon:yes stop_codon:yes gene_type:complete
MGADRVLVDAAFKEAATKYGGDVINMKPMYDSNVAGMNKVFNTINSAMGIYSAKKEVGRAGVRKQMAEFQAQANAGVKDMYAQDEPMPDVFISAFRKKITDLQDEFEDVNTYGKGDTAENNMARARIMGELKRVTNQATNFRANTNIFLDSIDNVNEGEVDAEDIAGSQQALDFSNYPRLVREGKISKVEYGENGIEITSKGYYSDASSSWGEEVVSLASLKAKFPQKNAGHHAEVFAIRNEYVTQGKIAASKTNPENDYNEKEANEAFTRQVNTREKFKNVVSSRIDGLSESSFKVNLEKNLQIPLSVLENMYYTEDGSRVEIGQVYKDLNLVDDGVIDEKDIAAGKGNAAFEQNLDSLIDALTNVDNPAFDIGLSASMLGGYLGEIAKSDYKEMYEKTIKENNPSSGKSGNYTVNNREMSAETFERSYGPMVRMINNPQEGDVGSANGHNFIYRNGEYYTESVKSGIYDTKITQAQVARDSGLLNYTNVTAPSSIEVKRGNTTPVPLPARNITSRNFKDNRAEIISALEKTYVDFPGFKFEYHAGMLKITTPDDKTTDNIKMNRWGSGNDTSQSAIQKFIQDNINGNKIEW